MMPTGRSALRLLACSANGLFSMSDAGPDRNTIIKLNAPEPELEHCVLRAKV